MERSAANRAGMRRRVYLLRHGEIAYWADPHHPVAPEEVVLTELGTEQARAAGRALAAVRFDRVVTSNLARTIDTARLVVGELDDPPPGEFLTDPDLEELRSGDISLVPDEGVEDAFLLAFRGSASHHSSFLGGETVGSLVARVAAAVARLYADPSWRTALVVAHGGVNRAILSACLAGPGAFFGHVEQLPGCINIIDGDTDPVIRAVNLTPTDLAQNDRRITTLEEMLEQYRDYRARAS